MKTKELNDFKSFNLQEKVITQENSEVIEISNMMIHSKKNGKKE